MPEKITTGDFGVILPAQQRHHGLAVDLLFRGKLQPGEFKQSRIEVDPGHGNITRRTRCHTRRELEVKRLAYTAFPLTSLAAAQW